jgi:hypothetical protein
VTIRHAVDEDLVDFVTPRALSNISARNNGTRRYSTCEYQSCSIACGYRPLTTYLLLYRFYRWPQLVTHDRADRIRAGKYRSSNGSSSRTETAWHDMMPDPGTCRNSTASAFSHHTLQAINFLHDCCYRCSLFSSDKVTKYAAMACISSTMTSWLAGSDGVGSKKF